MDSKTEEFRNRVDLLLAEGYRLWDEGGLPAMTLSDRYRAVDAAEKASAGEYAIEFAAACQCFYLFRKLHRMNGEDPIWTTLLGDYFFSQFSKHLIPIDSVALTDAFSAFLAEDTRNQAGTDTYLSFIGSLSKAVAG